jgi:hypothetical protein
MNYWKLRFACAAREQNLRELQAAAEQVNRQYADVLRAEGLDPERQYRLNDADESVTPVEPESEVPHA